MSNKIHRFFITFLILFPFSGKTAPLSPIDSLLSKAEQHFEYENYSPAIEIYEKLVEDGFFQEELLYRLAFMHEQEEEFSKSIYYLRKLQWEIGGNHLDDKIDQLVDKANRERLSAGDSWGSYRLLLNHWRWWLLGGLIGFTILAGVFIVLRLGPILSAIGFVSGGIAVLMGIMLIEHLWFYPPKAVVMEATAYYELPAYSSSYRSLPIGTGATVTIIEETDIWSHVSMGKFDGWVPKFVIREI